MSFTANPKYKVGIEIELQILDKNTWDLSPAVPVLLETVPLLLQRRLIPEFIQSILEIQTGICFSIKGVKNDLMQTVGMAEELAEEHDCRLFSASLHPFARYTSQFLTTSSRYERIMAELQVVISVLIEYPIEKQSKG